MLLLRLWNYIRGYVIIIVEGYFLEKFINVCIHRQIFLWDIKRQKNATMTLKVSIKGFKMLKPVANKTKCRFKIIKRKGLPFTLNRYKHRKSFVVGAVAFLFLVYTLTSFIWNIEITGNKKLESSLLLEKLEEMGVKPGIYKYSVNTDKIVNNLMLGIKDLAWASVVVKGTKIKIELAERVKPPELVPKDVPCDIVANKDGVIKSIIAKSGQEVVKPGNTVMNGQVLISGAVPNKNEQMSSRLVHAIGSVKARTWYEGNSEVNIKVIDKERTGRKQDTYSLVLFTKHVNLFHKETSYENYDKIEIKKSLTLNKDTVLPFEFIIYRNYENNLVEREISLEEAKQIATDNAYTDALKNVPENAEIVNKNLEFISKDDSLVANVTIECVEDIGVTKEIGGK